MGTDRQTELDLIASYEKDKPLRSSVWGWSECVCVCSCISVDIRTGAWHSFHCVSKWWKGQCMFVCVLEIAILSAASSCREAKLLQVGDAVEVNESPGDHQDVEQLMGVKLRRERRTKTAGHKNHGEEFLIQACFLTGDRHSPRCHTCQGRTSRGFGRRTDRLRWCRAWPWGTASPSGQWWLPWSDPHWWQNAGWEPRHSDQGPQTRLNKEWTQSEYTSEQI